MREEIREGRQSNIIAAGKKLFLQYGIKKTSLEDVAELAGIGKATLYHYFKGKEALFEAVIQSLFDGYLAAQREHLCNQNTAVDKLISYANVMLSQHREVSQSMIDLLESDREMPLKIHCKFRDMIDKETDIIEEMLIEGMKNGEFKNLDVKKIAFLILGSFRAMILHARKSKENEHEIIRDFLNILLYGIHNPQNMKNSSSSS
jgi:AcrR family transcriptional regulator